MKNEAMQKLLEVYKDVNLPIWKLQQVAKLSLAMTSEFLRLEPTMKMSFTVN
jgi:hypothetical protein